MKILGITGGVGAGKSTVLQYLRDRYHARLLICDEEAERLQKPGMPCYQPMLELFGDQVLLPDGCFDRKKLADRVFSDPDLLRQLNAIVHPAVKRLVCQEIGLERERGEVSLFVIEAALLLEGGYGKICDEIWFVYADESVRRERLRTSRGYSDEKISGIMRAQRPEEYFRKSCQFVVDNSSNNVENTYGQIDKGLKQHGFL